MLRDVTADKHATHSGVPVEPGADMSMGVAAEVADDDRDGRGEGYADSAGWDQTSRCVPDWETGEKADSLVGKGKQVVLAGDVGVGSSINEFIDNSGWTLDKIALIDSNGLNSRVPVKDAETPTVEAVDKARNKGNSKARDPMGWSMSAGTRLNDEAKADRFTSSREPALANGLEIGSSMSDFLAVYGDLPFTDVMLAKNVDYSDSTDYSREHDESKAELESWGAQDV